MKNPHRQVKLKHECVEMVCNVPDSPRLKVGNYLTLKDHEAKLDDPWWRIMWVSDHVVDKSSLHTNWNNNI